MAQNSIFYILLFSASVNLIAMDVAVNMEHSEVVLRLKKMEATISQLEENNSRLQKQQASFNTTLTALQRETTPLVAFSAYNPHDRTPETGHIIVFQSVYLNAGQGYDTTYGVFTAPVGGLYQFTAHFCNAPGKAMVFSIYLGRQKIAVTTVNDMDYSGCTSLTAVTMMEVRETVTVRGAYDYNELSEDVHRKASFIGLLLHL